MATPTIQRPFIKLMFWSISFLLICTYLFGSEPNTKVIEVLEKIEQLEKDGDKTYWNKIIRRSNLKDLIRSVLLCKSNYQRK